MAGFTAVVLKLRRRRRRRSSSSSDYCNAPTVNASAAPSKNSSVSNCCSILAFPQSLQRIRIK